jgi:hypothetical protein
MATDAHLPEQLYIELRVDAAVEVTTSWRDDALPL